MYVMHMAIVYDLSRPRTTALYCTNVYEEYTGSVVPLELPINRTTPEEGVSVPWAT